VIKASRSVRRDTPVLVKMWLRCVRAVASAIPSALAASVRLAPEMFHEPGLGRREAVDTCDRSNIG